MKFNSDFWVKALFYLLIILTVGFGLYAVKTLILPTLVGFLLAYLIQPVVNRLESYGYRRSLGIASVFSFLGLLMLFFTFTVIPMAWEEIQAFQKNSEQYTSMGIDKYEELKADLENRFPEQIPWVDIENKFTESKEKFSSDWVEKAPTLVAGSAEKILSFLMLVPLFAFFILKDGLGFKKWIISRIPNRYFELTVEIFHQINHQTGAFIRGQILDSTINAILISALLYLVGLPYYLLVGCFAGLANAIPFMGPILGAATAAAVAFMTGEVNVLSVLIVFGIAHLIDVMIIYPKTVGHSLHLHELVVIIGVIVGGHLGGVVGMLLVVPLIGITLRSVQVMHSLLRGYRII